MAKNKTPLRLLMEDYLSSGDEDWLDIKYDTDKELGRIRSMYHSIKTSTSHIDVDKTNHIVWIHC